jgi:hypothetical protein
MHHPRPDRNESPTGERSTTTRRVIVVGLLAADLIDEISLFTIPVVLGRGKKLFADGSAPHRFTLARSRACRSGVVVTHYLRAGAVKTDDTLSGSPSDAERKRQHRMTREDAKSAPRSADVVQRSPASAP